MIKNALTRFLICLFIILGISQISKSDQQTQFANRVSIYKGPWNILTPNGGITHYTIKNIPKSYQMALQVVNFDAAAASVILNNMFCSVDPNIVDYDSAANKGKFTNINFSANGASATSSVLTLVGGQTPNSGITITTPTLPCSSVTLEFSNATQVTTTVEIVATFSELVLGQTSASGGLSSGGGYVQGISPTTSNAVTTFPLVDGGLQPAINASFVNFGVDTFSSNNTPSTGGFTGNVPLASPPRPSSSSDWAVAFIQGVTAGGGTGILPPWVCLGPGLTSCGTGVGNNGPSAAALSGVSTASTIIYNIVNAGAPFNWLTNILLFNKTPVVRQNLAASSISATLAGSIGVISVGCPNFPCTISSITDSQGNVWKQVTGVTVPGTGGNQVGGLLTWVTGPMSAAAETVTITPQAGTTLASAALFLELTGITPANLNRPLAPLTATNNTFVPGEKEAIGLLTATSGFFVSNTLTISSASTVTVPLWDATQHGLFASCGVHVRVTAIAGTTPSLATFLQDTPDSIGFSDRMSFPAITATGNYLGSVAGGGINPVITTDGTMAVSTRLDGPLGPFGRLKFILTGTGPTATINYSVECR